MTALTKLLIVTMFIVSGVSSLVLESLWVRVLSLAVGSTSAALGMVLAIFFSGLALGSYLGGRFAEKLRRPVMWYGLVEGAVGLYSLALLEILLHFHQIISIVPHSGNYAWAGQVFKFAVVVVLIFPACVGMGASLPVLVHLFVRKKEKMGRMISALYGVNTLGAALGSYLAGFYFIPNFGITTTNTIACVINLGLALSGWLLSRYAKGVDVEIVPRSNEVVDGVLQIGLNGLKNNQKRILILCGLAGFSSISAEVVWNKYLGIYFGTNIYGLGLILSIFLVGIAAGAMVMALFIERLRRPERTLVCLTVFGLLGIYVSTYGLNSAPVLSNIAAHYLGDFLSLLSLKTLVATILLLPTTLVFGALFPLAIRLMSDENSHAPSRVGMAYAVNTIGSILASLVSGLILIPRIGSNGTIRVAILALGIGLGLQTLPALRKAIFVQKRKLVPLLLSVLFTALLICGQSVDFKNIIKSAYVQHLQGQNSFADVLRYFEQDYEDFKLIVEGETAVISLSHDRQDGESYKDFYRLKTNGLNESVYNRKNMGKLPKYEALLGFAPYSFSRNVQNAFVVGFGGGFTVDLLTSLGIEKVYVAELERGIIDAAQYVFDGKNPVLDRHNLDLHIEDARFVLATNNGPKFDMIVSQPSHSWLSGVANLFTREFFEIVRMNLSEKGVFAQWLNLYNMDEEVLSSIFKTFFDVFPHGLVITDPGDDELIMIGSEHELRMDHKRLDALGRNSLLRDQLSSVPIRSAADFVSVIALSRESVLGLAKNAPFNTDLNAFAEVKQSRLFYQTDKSMGSGERPSDWIAKAYTGDFSEFFKNQAFETPDFYDGLLRSLQENRRFNKYFPVLENFEKKFSTIDTEKNKLGYYFLVAQRYASARNVLENAMEVQPQPKTLNLLLSALVESKSYANVLESAKKYRRFTDDLSLCYLVSAQVYLGKKNSEEIQNFLSDLKRYQSGCGEVFNRTAGFVLKSQNQWTSAIPYLEAAYLAYPTDIEVLRHLTASYLEVGDWSNARQFAGYIDRALTESENQNASLVSYLRGRGLNEDAEELAKISTRGIK